MRNYKNKKNHKIFNGLGAIFVSLGLLFSMFVLQAYAVETTFDVQEDTALDSDGGYEDYNYGASDYGFASPSAAMLLKFDISSIPPGSTIITGNIRLTKLDRAGTILKLRNITNNSRIEGNKNGFPATDGEPTYNQREYGTPGDSRYNGSAGLVESSDYGDVDMVDTLSFSSNETKSFDLNTGAIGILQEYLEDSDKNLGFALVNANSRIKLASKENANASYRPRLTLTYTTGDVVSVTEFVGETPADNSYVEGSFKAKTNIIQAKLKKILWNRKGIYYPMYDESLIFMTNLDKISALGETDTKIQDLSSSEHTGIVVGATRTSSGEYNGSYLFDGSNDYIDVDMPLGDTLTISLRAKARSTGMQDMLRVLDDDNHGPDLRFANNNIYLNSRNGYNNPFCAQPTDVTGRHHYTTLLSAGSTKLYIDGELCGTANYVDTTATSFHISSSAGYDWDGHIDEVRIFNRILSTKEITQLYASNLNKYNINKYNLTVIETGIDENTEYTFQTIVQDVSGDYINTETRTINPPDVTDPVATFVGTTPANNSRHTGSIDIEAEITEIKLNDFTRNRSGTNYNLNDDNLIFMSNFDNVAAIGDTDIVIKDLSKRKHDATNHGTESISDGAHNNAYYFNRLQQDWIGFGDLGDPNAATISFRFKKANINQGAQYMFDARDGGNFYFLQDYAPANCPDTNGNLCFYNRVSVPSTMLANNTRFHVVVTVDISSTKIYLDGSLVDTGAGFNIDLGRLRAGTRFTNAGYFDGSMDEIRIYDRAISAEEVYRIYTSSLNKYDSDSRHFSITETGVNDDQYSFYISMRDSSNNQGSSETRTINPEDTVAPTASVSYNPSTSTTGDVIATLTGESENITITNNSGSREYIFTGNGSFVYEYKDQSDNTGETIATVSRIVAESDGADEEDAGTSGGGGSVGGGGGGGGGGSIGVSNKKDYCPDGDESGSYYDKKCSISPYTTGEPKPKITDLTIVDLLEEIKKQNRPEDERAQLFAKNTNMSNLSDLNGIVLRKHLAKFISVFSTKILGNKYVPGKAGCRDYEDISTVQGDLHGYIIMACELGVMGLESDGQTAQKNFNPDGEITRAQFVTAMSRLLRKGTYTPADGEDYYKRHMKAMKAHGYLNVDNPNIKEVRLRMLLMFYRIADDLK